MLKAGEEGAYEARVYVLWLTGWEESARFSFTARDSPRVLIEAPEEVELSQPLVVKISAYDSSGIVVLKARVNGSEVPLERRGGVWTFTLTPAEPGLLMIEATAVDPYGNEGPASLRVRVVEPTLLRELEEGLSEVEARALRRLYLLNSSLVRRAQPSLLRLAAKHPGNLSEEQALGLIDPSVVKAAVLVEVDGCSPEHLEAVKALRKFNLPYAVTFPACWIKACRPVAEALEVAEEVVCSAYARVSLLRLPRRLAEVELSLAERRLGEAGVKPVTGVLAPPWGEIRVEDVNETYGLIISVGASRAELYSYGSVVVFEVPSAPQVGVVDSFCVLHVPLSSLVDGASKNATINLLSELSRGSLEGRRAVDISLAASRSLRGHTPP